VRRLIDYISVHPEIRDSWMELAVSNGECGTRSGIRGARYFGYQLLVIGYQENLVKNNHIRRFFTVSHSSRN
jgi:hypothetical protein